MAAKDTQSPGKGIQTPAKKGPPILAIGGLALLVILLSR